MILASLPWYAIALIVVGSLLLAGFIFSFFFTFYVAKQVYEHTLVKRTPDEWGRVCSAPDNEEQVAMWNEGLEWGKANKEHMHEVQIKSKDGLKLFGEFFDFGSKETAIILSGRCECCWYGYYYALPYQKAGCNVLVIDQRAHGLSEGKYSTAGIKEHEDVMRWMAFLKDKFNQEKFILHCICVGSSTGLMAATTEFGKENVEKIVLDGAYINFKESYKRHYIAKGHALFPVYYEVWFWFRKHAGASANVSNPLKIIPNVTCPVLFIYSEEDIFSLPKNTSKLVSACASEKVVRPFAHGKHSHVRFSNKEEYDRNIIDFVR